MLLGVLNKIEKNLLNETKPDIVDIAHKNYGVPREGELKIEEFQREKKRSEEEIKRKLSQAQTHQVLRRIGKAMESSHFKSLNYDLTGRFDRDNISGIGACRERLRELLNIQISSKDVYTLLQKFDVDQKSELSISAVLGNALLIYDKIKREKNSKSMLLEQRKKGKEFMKVARQVRKIEKLKSELLIGQESNDFRIEEDEQSIEDYNFLEADKDKGGDSSVLRQLQEFAYKALMSSKMRYLRAVAPQLNIDKFRELLPILGEQHTHIVLFIILPFVFILRLMQFF